MKQKFKNGGEKKWKFLSGKKWFIELLAVIKIRLMFHTKTASFAILLMYSYF